MCIDMDMHVLVVDRAGCWRSGEGSRSSVRRRSAKTDICIEVRKYIIAMSKSAHYLNLQKSVTPRMDTEDSPWNGA